MLGGTPVAHHISDVLRARHGERIVLFHAGELYDTVVEESSRTGLTVSVESVRQSSFSSQPVVLLQAVIRPTLLDDVIHICTPLGVSRFILYEAGAQPAVERSCTTRTPEAGSSVIRGAVRKGDVPLVELATGLQGALSSAGPVDSLIMLSPRAALTMMGRTRNGSLVLDGSVAVVVGPEGGFLESEETQLMERAALAVRLSAGILRSELAGFAAMLMVRELQATS